MISGNQENLVKHLIILSGCSRNLKTSACAVAVNVRTSIYIYLYNYISIYISTVTARPLSPQEGARSRSPQLYPGLSLMQSPLIIYEFFIYLYNNYYDCIHFSVNQKMDYAYAYNAYGVVCTEVEIDVLTGQPQVLRVDILYDCGDRGVRHLLKSRTLQLKSQLKS